MEERYEYEKSDQSTEHTYDFTSPLWDNYFKRTRKNVRFPRNYREISALTDDSDMEQ